ncbi:hypothetical protein ACNOYE_17725 [Nannocystaceae bacterium ST9]
MASTKKVTLTWDPLQVETVLNARAAKLGPHTHILSKLYWGLAEYDPPDPRFVDYHHWDLGFDWIFHRGKFWQILQETCPTKIAVAPPWTSEPLPDGFRNAFIFAFRDGLRAAGETLLNELPREQFEHYFLKRIERMLDTLKRHRFSTTKVMEFMISPALKDSRSFWQSLHLLLPSEIDLPDLDGIVLPQIDLFIRRAIESMTAAIIKSLDSRLPNVLFRPTPDARRVEVSIAEDFGATNINTIYLDPSEPVLLAEENPHPYELSDEPSDQGLDSDAAFALLASIDVAPETRYEAALKLSSRPADQLRLFDYVIDTLNSGPVQSPWVHACVGLAEDLHVIDPPRRQALAAGLMRVANQLHDTGQREVVWIALGRWATLVPAAELSSLAPFLAPGTDVETMQCAAQCLWNCLAFEPTRPTLPTLEARCRELLTKYLDADWLSLPFARSLTANLLLAFSTLAREEDLGPVFERARELGQYFPWQLVRSKVRRMREHVTNHALSSLHIDFIEPLLAR